MIYSSYRVLPTTKPFIQGTDEENKIVLFSLLMSVIRIEKLLHVETKINLPRQTNT